MQIENFKIFADLVETKSFSKSAKLNGITQSAVSQQARAMERHFKTLLIDRSQKQFQLTREGQRVYDAAKEMLHTYEKLLSELQEMKKVISGTIRISTIYSIGLHELPPFIKKFLHDFPSVNVRVEYRRSNLVYEDILHNSVDFGLVAFPLRQRQIEVLPFRNDHLVVIAHPHHPLAKRAEIEVKDLANQKFIGFDPDIPDAQGGRPDFPREQARDRAGHGIRQHRDREARRRNRPRDRYRAAGHRGAGGEAGHPGRAPVQGAGIHPAARHPPPQGPGADARDEKIHRNARARSSGNAGIVSGFGARAPLALRWGRDVRATGFMKSLHFIAVCAGFLLGFTGCSRAGDAPKPTAEAKAAPGKAPVAAALPVLGPAPAWQLKDVHGQPVSSAQFKGKVVVIDFWATWCGPCRQEIPGYTDLQRKYGRDGLVIIGVSLDQAGPAVVEEFVKKFAVNYQMVMGDDAVQAAFGGIEAIPTTFLIDRAGQLRDRKVGAEPTEEYERKVVALLQ
jgi:DNA-binding transcriptional LysR family regulator/thiol-disulfide isomerase/thioredoxin